jgi:ATP:corrinoid adenosyltransferase
MSESPERDERHLARMLRKKAVMDERISSAPNECGLLLVLTGNVKGKSSSAFGMLAAPWATACSAASFSSSKAVTAPAKSCSSAASLNKCVTT